MACPKCLNIVKPPVMQCRMGHSICNWCMDEVQACPVCGSTYEDTRNFSLELLLERIPLPCKYRPEGCTFSALDKLKRGHEHICEYGVHACPAEGCRVSAKGRRSVLRHLSHDHHWEVHNVTDGVKGGAYESALILAIPGPESRDSKTVSYVLEVEQWGAFFVVSSVDASGDVLWVVQAISSEELVCEMKFISLNRDRQMAYSGIIPPLLCKVDALIEEEMCLKTSMRFLRATCPPDELGRCKMYLKIRTLD